MTTLKIKLDLKPLGDAFTFMSTQQREFAMRDALNRTVDKMFTVAKRGIAKEANIAIGDIAKGMTKIGAAGGALSAEVKVTDRWYPGGYKQFAARQGGGGSTFTPWKGHAEYVNHGFIASMRSGHRSIFVRMGKKRLPIEDVGWGPNPAKEMVREDHGHVVPKEISDAARLVFATRFAYQYERVVAQAKAKYGL